VKSLVCLVKVAQISVGLKMCVLKVGLVDSTPRFSPFDLWFHLLLWLGLSID
jgi:hypothetical protein